MKKRITCSNAPLAALTFFRVAANGHPNGKPMIPSRIRDWMVTEKPTTVAEIVAGARRIQEEVLGLPCHSRYNPPAEVGIIFDAEQGIVALTWETKFGTQIRASCAEGECVSSEVSITGRSTSVNRRLQGIEGEWRMVDGVDRSGEAAELRRYAQAEWIAAGGDPEEHNPCRAIEITYRGEETPPTHVWRVTKSSFAEEAQESPYGDDTAATVEEAKALLTKEIRETLERRRRAAVSAEEGIPEYT